MIAWSELTQAQKAVLAELYDNRHRLLRPGYVGIQVWGDDKTHRKPQHYARIGGRVLRSLEREGLVSFITVDAGRFQDWGWRMTPAAARLMGKPSVRGQR